MRNPREEIVSGIWEVIRVNLSLRISKEDIPVEPPKNRDFGDYTTNIPLKIARELNKKPIDVALELQRGMEHTCPWIEGITVVEPGFVNFILGERALYEVLGRREADYIDIFSREHVSAHWKGKLQAFLDEDGSRDHLRDLQYVHSRIHSILKLLREEGIQLEAVEEEQITYEKSDVEKEVLRRLGSFSEQVALAQKQDKPGEILKYAIGLGKLFFKLHEKTLFRQLERSRLYGALRIMEAMGLTIKTILEAFEIEALEKM